MLKHHLQFCQGAKVLLDKEAPVKHKGKSRKKKNSTEDEKDEIIAELREKMLY